MGVEGALELICMAYGGREGLGYEVLGWVRRAWDLGGGPRVGAKG